MLVCHSSIYLSGRLVSAFINILGLWAFSRLFAPEVFGVYVIVATYASVVQLALFQWLRVTLLRFNTAGAGQPDIRPLVLTLFLLMAVATGLLAIVVTLLFPDLHPYAGLTALAAIAVAWSELCLDERRARLKPWHYMALSCGRDLLFLLLALSLTAYGHGVWALIIAFIAASLLPTLPLLPRFFQGLKGLSFGAGNLSKVLRYGLPLAPTSALSALVNNADRLLLPLLLGAAAAGLYGPAHGLARQAIMTLMQGVNLAAFPLALRALERGGAAARAQLRDNLTILLAIGLPALVGLALLAPLLSHTLFGPEYAGAAERLLPWLAFGWFLHGLRSYYVEQAFQLGHDTRPALYVALCSAALALSVSLAGLWRFGLDGAAYGMVAGALLALALSWRLGRKIFPLPFPARNMAKVAAACALMAAVLWPQRLGGGVVPLGLALASGGLAYAAALFALNLLDVRSRIRAMAAR